MPSAGGYIGADALRPASSVWVCRRTPGMVPTGPGALNRALQESQALSLSRATTRIARHRGDRLGRAAVNAAQRSGTLYAGKQGCAVASHKATLLALTSSGCGPT